MAYEAMSVYRIKHSPVYNNHISILKRGMSQKFLTLCHNN